MNFHRKLIAALVCAFALFAGANRLMAAHLYAAGNGVINVYDIAANGTLTLRQTVSPAPGFFMAITPGGRFLYAAYDEPRGDIGAVKVYATQTDGTIRLQSTFRECCRGWRDIAMHPSGDYLYLVDGLTEGVEAYSTDDADGHLTHIGSFSTGIEVEHVATDPEGTFVFGGAHYTCPGRVTSVSVGAGGALSVVGRFDIPSVTGFMASDGRFLYVQGLSDACSNPEGAHVFSVLRIEPDGSLSTAKTYAEETGPMLPIDTFLALAKGSNLYIYAVDRMGNRTQTDQQPIQTFALAKGRNCWANNVWVATDDGIVTYSFDTQTGKLSRIGKAMVKGMTTLAFGPR